MTNRPTIDKAIILAAGMGRRISRARPGEPETPATTPKPLLPIGPEGLTFLDWHIRALAAAGCKEIYLVGSSLTFGTKVQAMEKIPATWIMNETPPSECGSGHSTWTAFTSKHRILDGESRVVLMDADICYDPSLYAELASAPGPRSKTLVCNRYRETDEEVLVFAGPDGIPQTHGKGLLDTPLVGGLKNLGEATGILLLEPGDHVFWMAAAEWCMKFSTAKQRSEHEDITGRLMLARALDAVGFTDDARCMECDTPDEYDVVRSEMVPRWLPHLR